MGWRWRKSANVGGGVRINTSQSGVGCSWGVPGFRIGKSAFGNWWISVGVPGTGLSLYRVIGRRRESETAPEYPAPEHGQPPKSATRIRGWKDI